MKKLRLQSKTCRKVKLGEVADINMGQSPRSEFYNTRGEGLPFYQGVTDFGKKYPKKSIYCSQSTKIAEAGDIFFSVRAPVGDVNIAIEKSCIGRGVAALRMKNRNNDFLYFLLKNYERYFKGIAGGTTYESINKDQIENVEFSLPENPTDQKRIADILSAFDDKIELNNKISQTLEQMAQAIFKEWFVNFKFPGHEKVKMVNSELGKILEGWEIKKFEDIMDFLNGEYIPQSKYDSEGEYLIYGSNTIMGRSGKYLYEGPVIILAKIGSYCGAIRYSHLPCWINNNAGGIKGKKEVPTSFVYYLLRRFNFNQVKEGTGQPFISMRGLKIQKAILPPQKLLDLFNKNIDNIKNYISNNEKENQKLAALRDLLLPKLMSGEVRV